MTQYAACDLSIKRPLPTVS